MRKTSTTVLGIYDVFLAMGAIWLGVQMITSSNGTFLPIRIPTVGCPFFLLTVGLCLGF